MRRRIFIGLWLLCGFSAQAIDSSADFYTSEEELNDYRTRYPNENAVVTEMWRELRVVNSGDSLLIESTEFQEIIILNNPVAWSKDRVYSHSFSYVDEIEAYSLVPFKKKYKKYEVEEFKRSFDKDSYVFYDDTEWISFNYPQLVEGAKIVNKYTRQISDPHLLSSYFFMSHMPIEKIKFTIVADKGIELRHEVYENPGLSPEFEYNLKEYVNDEGQKVIEYSAENLDKIKMDEGSPSFSYLCPMIHVNIASYADKDGKVTQVLADLDDLHAWYRTFVDTLEVSEAVKTLSNSLLDGTESDYEKVQKIFEWVQGNVRYIAFEQGMRGFIPHSSDYVLSKRYGDCKDMSSLLVSMLRSVGLESYYTWIGSRDLPYRYSELASPSVDNHMIASVELGDELVYLDATGGFTPLGYLTSMIQGKEALVSKGKEEYEILEVPVIPKEKNLMIDTVYVRLQDGVLYGEGRLSLTGLVQVANSYKLNQKTQKGEEKYLQRLLSKGSNKFLLDSYEIEGLSELSKPITIDYEFNIADYTNSLMGETYVNLCLDKSASADFIQNRSSALENDYQYVNRSVTVFEVPEGYEVTYLPENSQLETDEFGYDIGYELKEGEIVCTKTFYVNTLIISPDRFESWNNAISAYANQLRNTTVLKLTN
ncbi:transglutaminase-like domain-containing protein [Reichenbachiella ulvae]|uniref:Transglutaminase-like domain-containing protein n=1 Tax=Reichenbachiella ulvae TaxID=2980104 RepID=A0ABT3CRV7_9BACT|nr:transglutaminase-like domain-containing protein [Reichenbachiella ulvae]MCV9386347.1 transglutaminase-like domain-containing protein [Reichenbachiella ulvae]